MGLFRPPSPVPGEWASGRLTDGQPLRPDDPCRWCKRPLTGSVTKAGSVVIRCRKCDGPIQDDLTMLKVD